MGGQGRGDPLMGSGRFVRVRQPAVVVSRALVRDPPLTGGPSGIRVTLSYGLSCLAFF